MVMPPSFTLDVSHADGAVGAGSRKDNADRGALSLRRHGAHEKIDRQMRGPLALRRQPKSVLRNRQKGVRRNHIDTTGSYVDAGPDFLHRILVPFAMISVSMLWWLGSRCCTSTNAFRYPPAGHERTLHTPPGRPLTHDGHDRERGLLSCSSFAGTPIRHQTRIWIFRMSSSRPAGRSERGPGSQLFGDGSSQCSFQGRSPTAGSLINRNSRVGRPVFFAQTKARTR